MKKQFFSCFACIFSLLLIYTPVLSQTKNHLRDSKLAFEENKGQVTGDDAYSVNFTYKSSNLDIFLLKTGIAYQFYKINYPKNFKHQNKFEKPEERKKREQLEKEIETETYRIDVKLINANSDASVITEGKSSDYVNYYNHDALDVRSFEKVIYKNIYNNIDWVIYTTGNKIKYDFVVRPGGNPKNIQLKVQNAESVEWHADGSIYLNSKMGTVIDQAPVSYQNGNKIKTAFKITNDIISFLIENYDSSSTLVVDPFIEWSTYYGDNVADYGYACSTKDSAVYLLGSTYSGTNIASGGFQNTIGGQSDIFLTKFNSLGVRQWATYYGGDGYETPGECSVDNYGNIFFDGNTTSSTNIASGGFQNTYSGGQDAFLVKMNSAGIREWATYYGGGSLEQTTSCGVSNSGDVYILGYTQSTNNIAYNGYQNTFAGYHDVFLAKFSNTGLLQWSTYYGGSQSDYGHGLTFDKQGSVYFCGSTGSTTNIASGGFQNGYGGNYFDAFLVKFDTSGSRQWGTYFGGLGVESASFCAVDSDNSVYITGVADNLGTSLAYNGFQNSFGGGESDAFLSKYTTAGTRLWTTYYGGNGDDAATYCLVNPMNNNVYIMGGSSSTNNIAYNGFQNMKSGNEDAFIALFTPTGLRLWGTYYGGLHEEFASGGAIDNWGNLYISGRTLSDNIGFGGYQNNNGGSSDAILAKIVEECNTSFIVQQPLNSTICAGNNAMFKVSSSPDAAYFHWQENNGSGFNDINDGLTFQGTENDTLLILNANDSLNGNKYRCIVSYANTCPPVFSDSATLFVNSSIVPSINITSNQQINGLNIDFVANITNGGSNPIINWYKNGTIIMGATGLLWTGIYGVDFMKDDRINARLISNAGCAIPVSVWSDTIVVNEKTSISNMTVPVGFYLYPNPSNHKACIGGLHKGDIVDVFSVSGQRVNSFTMENDNVFIVGLEHIDSGTYVFHFQRGATISWYVKFIKQ